MKMILKNNRGIALILTLMFISVIVLLTLQFSTSMRSDLYAAVNLKDGIRLGCIARSGFNYGIAVLSIDASEGDYDSLQEVWADSTNLSEGSASMFDDGRLEIVIKDCSGRIQINQLVNREGKYNEKQKEILSRFLNAEEFGIDTEEVDDIIDAIKDWIDSDNEVTRFGAENSYYQSLDNPYSCRNGPMESLEELLLVKGVTRELFYGTSENAGISGYLSVHGSGKININTADPLILRSLSDQIDEEIAQDMVLYRNDEDNNLKDPKWHLQISGMGDITIEPDLITTSSTYFEIISKGIHDTMDKSIKGIVERKDRRLRILSWDIL